MRPVRAGSGPSSLNPRSVDARLRPVVARPTPIIVRYKTNCRPIMYPMSSNLVPDVARSRTRRRLLRTRSSPKFFNLYTRRRASFFLSYPSLPKYYPSSADSTRRRPTLPIVGRLYPSSVDSTRRQMRNLSHTHPPHPDKYAHALISLHFVRASWPALALAAACGILHGVLNNFHRMPSMTTMIGFTIQHSAVHTALVILNFSEINHFFF